MEFQTPIRRPRVSSADAVSRALPQVFTVIFMELVMRNIFACCRTAVAVAFIALLLIGGVRGPAVADMPSVADQEASSDRIASARSHLGRGEATRAYREFARELHFWDAFQRQSLGYIDCERGVMIAAIFMRDDRRANAIWQQIGGESLEPAADRLVFAGRWNDAFRAYRDATQDLAMADPRAPAPDRVIAAGVARVLQGDFRGAIRAWSQPAVGGGPYDLTDEQTALVGLARARLGDWKGAEAAWIAAARTQRLLPQMAELYDGNAMGLSMLMHFRSHFARGDHAYRWTFAVKGRFGERRFRVRELPAADRNRGDRGKQRRAEGTIQPRDAATITPRLARKFPS